ncbi:MAG: hypothetical protein RLZZ292_1872, partial [Bacteroidota bacterium]
RYKSLIGKDWEVKNEAMPNELHAINH